MHFQNNKTYRVGAVGHIGNNAYLYGCKTVFMAFDFKKEYKEFYLPPLEGLWWSDKGEVDYAHKEDFQFISMIRLPDFVTQKDLNWAIAEAIRYPVQSTLYL